MSTQERARYRKKHMGIKLVAETPDLVTEMSPFDGLIKFTILLTVVLLPATRAVRRGP